VALREAGLRGYRLNWKKAPGRPDIAYPGRRVAIFVHGCFWHHCPTCHPNLPKSNTAFWARKFELNQARDVRKRADLERIGWDVVEARECELRDEEGEVVSRVAAIVARR
jgi:DNA mismatch endonuclease (patch repair protein)